ncbi:MAG: RdgB/HAM1 family non-canonical purine NTP pyrophosphatase [Gammaproteobacteria bacterium]|nr:MAG: RdgB/HAM1 family non-canonical purine NTP pyrophosphatase [Gammaproteobacteria bacterium]TDJ42030.1 MAG: RdgB/HAM1 family non-canonical purine NTP pyrophosphatase [Gammaproteobacteria bacterium]
MPVEPHRIVLASNNQGKLAELRALFEPWDVALLNQAEIGIEPAAENAPTFLENALTKARHAAERSGHPAIGDDSGLVVEALGGAPGIYSARFAGETASDAENNVQLVEALAGYPPPHRAMFCCVLVYLHSPNDPTPLVAHGDWHGEIVPEPRGVGGFGYDPHFLIPELRCTAAELSDADKRQHSHRARAARSLVAQYLDARGGRYGS